MATETPAGNIPLREAFETHLRKGYGEKPTDIETNTAAEELRQSFERAELVANVYENNREFALPASGWRVSDPNEVCPFVRSFFFGDLAGRGLHSGCTPYTPTLRFYEWLDRLGRSRSKSAGLRRGYSLKSGLAEWYRNEWIGAGKWRETVGAGKKSPSEEDDLQAARFAFGEYVSRQMIREARKKYAPSDWKLPGKKGRG